MDTGRILIVAPYTVEGRVFGVWAAAFREVLVHAPEHSEAVKRIRP